MSNKTNIEQDIDICKNIIKQNNEIVKQTRKNKDINAMQLTANCDRESKAIENILAYVERLEKENMKMEIEIAEQVYFGSMPIEDMKQLQAKANKYDSLVEKIKNKINNLKEEKYILSSRQAEIMLLQELLDTEKEN